MPSFAKAPARQAQQTPKSFARHGGHAGRSAARLKDELRIMKRKTLAFTGGG